MLFKIPSVVPVQVLTLEQCPALNARLLYYNKLRYVPKFSDVLGSSVNQTPLAAPLQVLVPARVEEAALTAVGPPRFCFRVIPAPKSQQ